VAGAVDAVGIAEVVQMNGAGVVGAFDVVVEDGVERPLFEDELGDAEVDRFGVVVDDVGVFVRFGEHQVVDVVERNAVEGEVAQLRLVAALGQLVINEFADERGVNGGHFAADDPVFNRFGDADGGVDG